MIPWIQLAVGAAIVAICAVRLVKLLRCAAESAGHVHDWEVVKISDSSDVEKAAHLAVMAEREPTVAPDMPWRCARTGNGSFYYNQVCLECGAVDLQVDRAIEREKERIREKFRRSDLAEKLLKQSM